MRPAILDVVPTFRPDVILALFGDADSHSRRVKTHWLCEIDNSELYRLFSEAFRDLDRIIEPLMVASSVGIDSHVQIVIVWLCFDDHIEVARLEIGVKSDLSVICYLWVHSCEYWSLIKSVWKHVRSLDWKFEGVAWVCVVLRLFGTWIRTLV